MIPRHSMTIHMSKRLKLHPNTIQPFLDDIISAQQREIDFMKRVLVDPTDKVDSTYTLQTNI